MSTQIVRTHILLLALLFVISAFGLTSIILFTDPNQTGSGVHILLYTTLLLTFATFTTLVGILVRAKFFYGLYAANFKISLRQGVLLGLLLTVALFLQSTGLLVWWVFLLLILCTTVLEIFFNL